MTDARFFAILRRVPEPTKDLSFYRSLRRIRRFEETVLENFSKGVFYGTTHTSIGQEADAVGVLDGIQAGDIVVSNHRSHGHFLAYGGDMHSLFAELMGKAGGVCGGWGGSQHLHWRNFYSNGVQGGMIPAATGMALAEKSKASRAVVIAFLGDGTLGEGVIYEAFNMAALWSLPILYVVENNRIAQTTPVEKSLAGSMLERLAGFGLVVAEVDSSDVQVIDDAARVHIAEVRGEMKPHALIIDTCRFAAHSKGDDTRPTEEVAAMRARRDPLDIQGARLAPAERKRIDLEVETEVEAAYQQAFADPFPPMLEGAL